MIDEYNSVEGPKEYGSLPEDMHKECEPICKGKSIQDLRRIADYFNHVASQMQRAIETEVTYDDFEDKKKMTDLAIPTED